MDLISRAAAIDIFRRLADDEWNKHTGASWADGYESAIEILEDIPVAQERKKGKWKPYPIAEDCVQCSNCGVLRMGEASNYCPNCGTDMRGEEDG